MQEFDTNTLPKMTSPSQYDIYSPTASGKAPGTTHGLYRDFMAFIDLSKALNTIQKERTF